MHIVDQQGVTSRRAQPWRWRRDQPGSDGRIAWLPELVGILGGAERPPLERDRSAIQVAQESERTIRSVEPDLVARHTEPPRERHNSTSVSHPGWYAEAGGRISQRGEAAGKPCSCRGPGSGRRSAVSRAGGGP